MHTEQEPFVYKLPEERIAQRPVQPYDSARLLLVERQSGQLSQKVFSGIGSFFREGDLILFNDTKVIPARFTGHLEGREGEVELFLIEKLSLNRWRCIGKPMRKLLAGVQLNFKDGLKAVVQERGSSVQGDFVVARFLAENLTNEADVEKLVHSVGNMPIPPYIRKGKSDESDRHDYQTCFAKVDGSVAAPTASLHFTPELLSKIKSAGCDIRYVTLHVGAASIRPLFRPEQGESADQLKAPPGERFIYDPQVVSAIRETKARGGRVVAVGTTVVRAVESMMRGEVGDETALFIRPGFDFKAVDILVTNFHQPATTHLLLVEAFMKDRALLERSYNAALDAGFRFLSYGDGMMVL